MKYDVIIIGAGVIGAAIARHTRLSGYRFKFAPFIGEIVGELITKGVTSHDISRFRINRS